MPAKHHYLPQLYLKRFVDPASSSSRTPYLWVMDILADRVSRRAPRNIAARSGLYDWRGSYDWTAAGVSDPSLERVLGTFESRVAPLLRRLSPEKCRTTAEERYHLSNFLGLQLVRTPMSLKLAETAEQEMFADRLRRMATSGRSYNRFISFLRKRNVAELPSKEQFRNILLGRPPRLKADSDRTLAFNFWAGLELLPRIIFALRWTWLSPANNLQFFTSDQPVALRHLGGVKGISRLHLELPFIEVSFAVSPTLRLLAHNSSQFQAGRYELNAGHTDAVNRSVLAVRERYFFCASEQTVQWVAGGHRDAANRDGAPMADLP
jgi:hypothetical protein